MQLDQIQILDLTIVVKWYDGNNDHQMIVDPSFESQTQYFLFA